MICSYIDLDYILIFINLGVDINYIDKQGKSVLTWAVLHNRKDKVKLIHMLLDKGADINAQNDYGMTTLMWAVSWNSNEAKILLECGADVNIKDKRGVTALAYAIFQGNVKKFKLLLSYGADIYLKDKNGNTGLDQVKEAMQFCDGMAGPSCENIEEIRDILLKEMSYSLGIVTDDYLRIRQEPNLNAGIKGYLMKGDRVAIVKRTDKKMKINDMRDYWYYIKAPKGIEGWVYGYYLDIEDK